MKKLKLLLTSTLIFSLMGCSTLPLDAFIKEDHFRFENFKRDKNSKLELIHLMCFKKKETAWAEPKQYLSGEHNLWVKANISTKHISNSKKESFVNFKVKLASNKSYMLNRKRVDNKLWLWIQEVDTGLVVSDVLTSNLKSPKITDYNLRKRQCKLSSV